MIDETKLQPIPKLIAASAVPWDELLTIFEMSTDNSDQAGREKMALKIEHFEFGVSQFIEDCKPYVIQELPIGLTSLTEAAKATMDPRIWAACETLETAVRTFFNELKWLRDFARDTREIAAMNRRLNEDRPKE